MKTMRRTKLKDWFEFYRIACPICGHVGGCMQHKEGDRVACIRTTSEYPFSKNSALPSYLHFLKGNKKRKKIQTNEVALNSEKKADNNKLHRVYKSMLDKLELSDEHYQHLISKERGLTDAQIQAREYRSFPDKPWNIVKEIQKELNIDDFTGIPGFYETTGKYGKYWTIAGRNGILLPYRNIKNQIIGFQYRVDNPPNAVHVKENREGLIARIKEQPNLVQIVFEGEILYEQRLSLNETVSVFSKDSNQLLGWVTLKKGNRYFWLSSANKEKGTGSGDPAPVHISIPTKQLVAWNSGEVIKRKKVWLSEGPLKCDIATEYMVKLMGEEELDYYGSTFIALPGVNSWQLILPVLKAMEVEEINICFDADVVSNIHVKKPLIACLQKLRELKYRVNMVIWNGDDGKGIDDLLINKKIPQIKSLF